MMVMCTAFGVKKKQRYIQLFKHKCFMSLVHPTGLNNQFQSG